MTRKLFQKVAVIGAGAIGGWIGARLAAAGCQVSMVARGATLQALSNHGLRLSEGGHDKVLAVRSSDNPADLGVQDLVVIAVKAPSLLEVARHIAPLLGPETVVLTAMNGVPWWFFQGFGAQFENTALRAVDATGEIGAAIPSHSVIGCVVHASCSTPEPG